MTQTALPTVLVVAVALIDTDGRVLIAQRPEGKTLAGLWEFPGGKVEPGERPEAALIRELHEELGVVAQVGSRIIQVPQRYPDKHLVLEVRHITALEGRPRGHEGQAITWVAPEKLHRYSMPPADVPVVAALAQPDRYLITPALGDDVQAWLAALERAIASGVQRVQLRLPGSDPRREAVLRLAVEQFKHRAQLLINRDVALAAELGVGVHLGSEQLLGLAQRPPLVAAVAASCHDRQQLQAAQALGCDFVVLGPVRPTASHPGAAVLGWEGFAALRAQCALPIYALGGLDMDDLAAARDHGAQGIAAIAGLWPGRVIRG